MIQSSKFLVSEASLASAAVVPSARCVSSRDVGWTSLLLDHHFGARSMEAYRSSGTPDLEIGIATFGRYASEVMHEGQWRRGFYSAGAVCINDAGEGRRIRFLPMANAPSSTAMVYLPRAQVMAATEHLRRAGQAETTVALKPGPGRDPAISQMVASLIDAMAHEVDDLYAQTASAWLAVHLAARYGKHNHEEDRRHGGVIADARLARVIEYMSVNFASQLTLDDLASQACISKFHFVRAFRDKVGQTPHSYLTALRLSAARQMITCDDMPISAISAIAAACGYRSASNFSAAFKAKFGQSPKELRSPGN